MAAMKGLTNFHMGKLRVCVAGFYDVNTYANMDVSIAVHHEFPENFDNLERM